MRRSQLGNGPSACRGGGSYLGIEIGGTKIQVAVGTAEGTIQSIQRKEVDLADGAEGIRDSVLTLVRSVGADTPPVGVGVGFGGPVDRRNGRVITSMQVEGWTGFDICGWLESVVGVRPLLENDANAAALAEAIHGAGSGSSVCFYVTLGSGLGGGLVINGSIYHGSPASESEVGLARISKSGERLEDLCSGWAVNRRVRKLAGAKPDSRLATVAALYPGHEAKALSQLAAVRDTDTLSLLDEVADDLAFGLNHVVHLLSPEVIVLGGGLSLIGESLRARVAARLPHYISRVFGGGPRIALAALGEEVVCRGALLLAATQSNTGGYNGIS
jgi:glucokinase